MQNTTHHRWIGTVSIAAGLLALASLIAILMAVNYRSDAIADPLLVLHLPDVNTGLVKWSMLFDMLGYYLLLLPLVFLLRDYFKDEALLSRLSGACGAAYVLIGAMGAAVLAVVWPYIIAAYKTAGPEEQKILAANFRVFNMMVYEGLWNLLETIFAAAWWMITGVLLFRRGFSVVGGLTVVLSLACLADAASGMFGLTALHRVSLNLYLLLSVAWTVVMGILVLRKRLSVASSNGEVQRKTTKGGRAAIAARL